MYLGMGSDRRKDYEENSEKMLDLLVKAVLDVNPRIPEKKKRKD